MNKSKVSQSLSNTVLSMHDLKAYMCLFHLKRKRLDSPLDQKKFICEKKERNMNLSSVFTQTWVPVNLGSHLFFQIKKAQDVALGCGNNVVVK